MFFFLNSYQLSICLDASWYLYYSLSKVVRRTGEKSEFIFVRDQCRHEVSHNHYDAHSFSTTFTSIHFHHGSWNLIMVGNFGFRRLTAFLQGKLHPVFATFPFWFLKSICNMYVYSPNVFNLRTLLCGFLLPKVWCQALKTRKSSMLN